MHVFKGKNCIIRSTSFLNVIACSFVKMYQCFREMCCSVDPGNGIIIIIIKSIVPSRSIGCLWVFSTSVYQLPRTLVHSSFYPHPWLLIFSSYFSVFFSSCFLEDSSVGPGNGSTWVMLQKIICIVVNVRIGNATCCFTSLNWEVWLLSYFVMPYHYWGVYNVEWDGVMVVGWL